MNWTALATSLVWGCGLSMGFAEAKFLEGDIAAAVWDALPLLVLVPLLVFVYLRRTK